MVTFRLIPKSNYFRLMKFVSCDSDKYIISFFDWLHSNSILYVGDVILLQYCWGDDSFMEKLASFGFYFHKHYKFLRHFGSFNISWFTVIVIISYISESPANNYIFLSKQLCYAASLFRCRLSHCRSKFGLGCLLASYTS